MTYSRPQSTALAKRLAGPRRFIQVVIEDLHGIKTEHRLIAVNLDEKCNDFQSAVDRINPPGEDVWGAGWNGPLSQVLGVYRRGVPTAALLDRDGRLLQIVTGADAIMQIVRTEP